MNERILRAVAGELAGYENAYQHGHVSEQASAGLKLLRAVSKNVLAPAFHTSNNAPQREIARRILAAIEGSAGK
ncbi:hypothetical protein [Manganibacter manganicus]|uniref:Uncharacterized protein n=1 Tax=Manganibacter manganicus TaxID=1873176 RepID=A0A1V8RNF6_9HYPH|nr:hypothetical protein [Pseudaminobacter manganicus]OQM74718.1 hypothetical protein BFN67_03515 [Pseudaminobacter manganicus]